MSYVDGKEETFQGFGGVEDDFQDFLQKSCAVDPTQPACKAYFDKMYAPIRAASQAAVKQLEKNPLYGPVLAQALDGARDPKAIAERARQIAAGIGGGNFEKNAYRFFYSQAQSGLELADQYLSVYPEARVIGDVLKTSEHMYIEGKNIFERYEKTGVDAAGVGDIMSLMKKSVGTAKSLARAFGVSDGSTADEVLDWTGIALGCGAAIATGAAAGAPGIIGGALTCAVSVLAQVFGKKVKPPGPHPDTLVMARFTPTEGQRGLIAADAVRLASLLRYVYGYSSWGTLLALSRKQGAGWPKLSSYNTLQSGEAIGFTPTQSITLFGDIPTDALTATTKTLIGGEGDVDVVGAVGVARLMSKTPGYDGKGLFTWAELVTFFAAVTARELSIDPVAYVAPWKEGLPVRFYYMTEAAGSGFSRFSDDAWSNLSPNGRLGNLMQSVSSVSPGALYEIGCLRLVAALSYLQMMYRWGEPVPGAGMDSLTMGRDVVGNLDNLAMAGPEADLRVPISPRRKDWGGMIPSIQEVLDGLVSRGAVLNKIADSARSQARADFDAAAGAFKQSLLELQHGAPQLTAMTDAANLKQIVAARGGLQLMPGAQFTPGEGWTTGTTQSSGVGTAVLVGAAALLALKFLK